MKLTVRYPTSKQVRPSSGADVYPHMPILRPHAARTRHVSRKSLEASHYHKDVLADSSDFGLLGEQSSQKWEIHLPWTLTSRRAKFDSARFILGGEIRN